MRNKYTDSEIKTILKNLCVIVDTREQVWTNIKDYLEAKKIAYRQEKINQGDYSICILSNEETKPLGINKDIYFDNEIVIERKNSIDEIANNLKDPERSRIEKEFSKLKSKDIKTYLFVQDKDFDINIRKHNYRSQYSPTALYGSIKSLESEFNIMLRPVDQSIIASEIYYTLYYHVRNRLRGKI